MRKSIGILLVLALLLSMSMTTLVAAADDAPVKFTATFLKNDWHGDPNDMEIMQRLEKEANVDVEWQVYSNATWNEKKNLLINSGDVPDVFYMNAVNSADIEKYGPQGMFLELGGLIGQYAPRLAALMEANPTYKAICTSPTDGKIYMVSRAAERQANTLVGQMYIYQPWLDKLGLSAPATYEEFYNVLKAFKEQDPNGNGLADEKPFAFSNMEANYNFGNLFGMFGYAYGGTSSNRYVQVEGEVIYVPQTESYKNAILYFHRMFEEGLFDAEDFATQDTKLLNSKAHSDPVTVGCFIGFDKNILVPAERLDDYTQMEPMAGPDGQKVWLRSGSKNNMGGTQFVMTYKAKGKEETILRWLDAHFDPTTSIELFLGPVGVTLQKGEDGMLHYVDTPEGMSYSEFRYGNCPVHVPCVIGLDQWNKDIEVMAEDADRWVYMEEVLKPYLTQNLIYEYQTAEDSKFRLGVGKDIDEYVKTAEARWLMEGGIDAEWDTFQSQLVTMGIDQYTQVMQGMVDRFNKAGE